jgi:hypothetical protein
MQDAQSVAPFVGKNLVGKKRIITNSDPESGQICYKKTRQEKIT